VRRPVANIFRLSIAGVRSAIRVAERQRVTLDEWAGWAGKDLEEGLGTMGSDRRTRDRLTVRCREIGRLVRVRAVLLAVLLSLLWPVSMRAEERVVHTNPLNREPEVRAAYERFYTLDYDGALKGFQKVEQANPDDPMAVDYVLETVLFHKLYDMDLLDTTMYAHDGFLTGKHQVVEDKAFSAHIEELSNKAIHLAEQRLQKNPKDENALYARGWSKSLRATYVGLVQRSFYSALRLALQARDDNDKVLEIDPDYVDAELVVGVHQYVVGSLPRAIKLVVGLAGIHGNKEKGLAMLRDDAKYGVTTSVEARTALALFLRREAKYDEAAEWNDSLKRQYPHNFLFWLESANLQKDAGNAQQAIVLYRALLDQSRHAGYFTNAHLQLAWFGLAETLRGQRDAAGAADAFQHVLAQPTVGPDLKRRAQLGAGMEYDLMGKREQAEAAYRDVLALGESEQASDARRYLKEPYKG
jgi:tetratricopeptide (TPR) repeat protein